jgi:hypothetical protein
MRKSRIALLSVLALVVASLTVPASSLAVAGSDTTVCTFSGQTSALDDIPGIVASEQQAHGDALDDALSAIPGNQAGETGVIIETGSYAFGTAPPFMGVPNQCLHVDVDGAAGLDPDGTDDTGVRATGISVTNGSYDNVLCGTGLTNGTATVSVTGDGEVASVGFGYTIGFAAGQGAAAATGTVTATTGNPNPATRPVAGAGFVHIEGQAATAGATACGNSDAADFNVFGGFTGSTTS